MKILKGSKTTSINGTLILNFLSTAILSGINFLTIPIFTRVLGAEQFGKYSVFSSWVSIISCFMGLQSSSCMGVGVYRFENDYKRFRTCMMLFGVLLSGIIIVPSVAFSKPLSELLGYEQGAVILMFMTALTSYVVSFVSGTLVYEKQASKNCILSVGVSLVSVGLSLALTKVFAGDELYLSRVYGGFIPNAICAVVFFFLYFFRHPSGLVKEYCKFGLTVGTPLVLHKLSQSILSQSDRVMMQSMGVSDAGVGIYSFFYSYTNIVMVILTALNTSWCPFYYEDLHHNDIPTVRKKSKHYIEFFTAIVCGFLLLAREVTYLFASEEYWGGMPVIPVLVSATYFTFLYQFAVNFELFNQKTKIIAIATCGASIMNIVLNACMIPAWGYYGAAIATSISYAALVVVHYIAANRINAMPFHAKIRDFIPGLLAVLTASIAFYVLADYWLIRWILGALLGVILIIRIIKRKSIF